MMIRPEEGSTTWSVRERKQQQRLGDLAAAAWRTTRIPWNIECAARSGVRV